MRGTDPISPVMPVFSRTVKLIIYLGYFVVWAGASLMHACGHGLVAGVNAGLISVIFATPGPPGHGKGSNQPLALF